MPGKRWARGAIRVFLEEVNPEGIERVPRGCLRCNLILFGINGFRLRAYACAVTTARKKKGKKGENDTMTPFSFLMFFARSVGSFPQREIRDG
jgi:hypothetical protein